MRGSVHGTVQSEPRIHNRITVAQSRHDVDGPLANTLRRTYRWSGFHRFGGHLHETAITCHQHPDETHPYARELHNMSITTFDPDELMADGDLSEVDPDTDLLIGFEQERQARRLILIPSESMAPKAVRQAMASVFNNIYAEGYPHLQMTRAEVDEIVDYKWQLARYRRYSDRRFYKGTEYANLIEALAQRRCAKCFATDQVPADHLFVNVQPLSGAAANNAVYEGLVEPGGTVMGMALTQGGHLTHGSEFNRSGKRYNAVSYEVHPTTGRLDYDAIMELALEHRPRMIIAGYTSYSWAPDWSKFRDICDAVGDCILLADIAQPAGMVIAGQYPTPVGWADVITFTTHKTLCGPRGAVIMTGDQGLARILDQAVFPGEQGGPHVSNFAAMAVAFRIAQSERFRHLQQRIVANSAHLAEALQDRDIPLAYGGTDTHMCVADLSSFVSRDGCPLKGEIAARILDLCGIVVNKNTIPGDRSAADASGIRLGTPWITQRGLAAEHIDRLADIIGEALTSIRPYASLLTTGLAPRGKIRMDTLERLKAETEQLIEDTMPAPPATRRGYPHRFLAGESAPAEDGSSQPPPQVCEAMQQHPLFAGGEIGLLALRGERPVPFLQNVLTGNVAALDPGHSMHSFLLEDSGELMDDPLLICLDNGPEWDYIMVTHAANHARVTAWLRGHSDGYLWFDDEDIHRKIERPVVVDDLADESADPEDRVIPEALCLEASEAQLQNRGDAGLPDYSDDGPRPTGLQLYRGGHADRFDLSQPYFIGQRPIERAIKPVPRPKRFEWQEPELDLRRTPLYDRHTALTNRMSPFAGWEMPLWYSSISEEHATVRTAAGLFDISHMGCIGVSGRNAHSFLGAVTTNYVRMLEIGQSQYSFILDTEGMPVDDVIVYRRGHERFMMVVNAANSAKVWAWLQAVNSGDYVIDEQFPHRQVEGPAELVDLTAAEAGDQRLVGLALQGPVSDRLLRLVRGERTIGGPLATVRKFEFIEDCIGQIPALISRTGYTGEEIGYELYVHPDDLVHLWDRILEAGSDMGVAPAGLGARDSTRIEAGLPLYGHEIAGPRHITPSAAGYGAYVRLHKPFFIGREALMARDEQSISQIVRFQVDQPRAHAIRSDDLVASRRGKIVGAVTSCTLAGDRQVGLAYVNQQAATPDTPLLIYPARQLHKMPEGGTNLQDGAQLPLYEPATVLPRFPNSRG